MLEGRPNTDGGRDGVVEVEIELAAAFYLFASLDPGGARDALWALVDAAAGREPEARS